ncbi:hypothetical protein WICPIJ_005825 [Wickerhamomyces pijperi]|uniref:CBS domain-containing protein n=1 Tax=Wickerhamomyces pijperi TaxID=599730 RepID=A0A9P8Q3B8_WICPI|nr:hypothetical protein WICPIJ_005825 [Wickerhamomyces pijperi]
MAPPKFTPQPNSSFRAPLSPSSPLPTSRHSSIVELLSTPPPLEATNPSAGAIPAGAEGGVSDYLSANATDGLVGNANVVSAASTAAVGSFSNENPLGIHLSRNASQSSTSSVSTTATNHIRDWQDIKLSELIESAKLIFIESSISVEQAFNTLETHNLTSLPVVDDLNSKSNIDSLTFDYTDLNAYLLLVLGRLQITEEDFEKNNYYKNPQEVQALIAKAKKGEQVPVKFVTQLVPKNPFYKLSEQENLSSVVEILGTGVHRIAIVDQDFTRITGILSQRRLIKYFWDNARRFPSLEPLFQSTLAELSIGEKNVVSIQGDEPLINALTKMAVEKVSSIAVVDSHFNLMGNISVTDVKHVTKSSQSQLLHKSCLHFISVILNSRGLEDGKDSFPIFHTYESSSLARTIAKLVATRAHRLWVVRPFAGSNITTPSNSASLAPGSGSENILHEHDGRAGKLIGVVSLTDILGLIARKHGKNHVDPKQARMQRRRSSSSSSRSSQSLEQFRRSISGASDLR